MAAPGRGTDAALGARDDAPPSPPKFHHDNHHHHHHHHHDPNHHRRQQSHHDHHADHASEPTRSPPANDPDHTPRAEAQLAEDTQPAWQSLPATHHTSDLPYHSPRPLRYHTAYLPTSHSASADPSPSQTHSSSSSLNNMAGHRESSDAHDPQRLQQRTPERPAFRRDQLSSASTASNCTVRAPPVSDPVLPTAARSNQRPPADSYPRYPNQSYSVLQSQEEFMRYPNPPLQAHQIHPPGPHLLRTRSSHPSQYSSFSSVSTGLHPAQYIPIEGVKTHDHGIRTAGNSPATSPGLFDIGQPIRPVLGPSEEHGYYSSPYLHFTQRQVPKETHVADVDVDPISGRKIINQYEIIDELGRGVHGKVKLGRSLETGQFVAIKIVDRYSKRRRLGKNTSHEDKIRKEIAILKKARHPNIVGLLEVIDDPSRKKVYIVLEHVELGEVRWRTEGSREIIQIEHRRYEREARGIFDNESAALEDQRILLEAQRKRERQEKRRLRRLHAKREHEAGAESWSFEHGGDTEDEDSEGEEISRTSTATNEDPMGLGRKRSRAASPTDLDAETTPHAPLNERVEELRESMPSSSSLPSMGCEHSQEEPRSQSVTGLEGTMYGAYVNMPFRGRNPSIAGSSSSNNLDQLEDLDVPEHFRYVPLMTLSATRNAFRDTVLGLEYLHYQGVVHRDIKPANLLQSRDNRIKISDFGVSYLGRRTAAAIGDDQSESDAQDVDEAIELAKTVGTPAFYAPELCQTDADADALPVTGQIDVWALGVTLYCLVFGRVPFHDLNTFVVMRLIAEDEVYIPRFRLRAVDDRSGSRPGSHSRFFNPMTSNKRGPHDLVYEEIDDDLYDLLKRLFIKDPRRRITLREVKHHPWVLRDIADPIAWLEETDPSRETQGKKIEVSPNDVENAVVQLNLLERVKSGMRKLGGALGIGSGSKSSKSSRERPKGEGGVSSAASSSSTISQDARRSSLRPDDTIFAALRASRESDHPLSQSVTVSPDVRERAEFFIGPTSRPDSPDDGVDDDVRETTERHDQLSFAERASQSSMSTAGSVRTLRQADFDFVSRRRGASPTMPQGVPSTPLTLDTPGASNLSGIFGGAGRRILRSVRSKERSSTERKTPAHSRATSIDRLVAGEEVDPHGEPSIALSDAVASGHVDPPAIPTESSTASSVVTSPASPVSHSTDARRQSRDGTPSRQSSISSTSSHRPRKHMVEEDRMYSLPAMQEYLDERFNRARDENRRRRIAEEQSASRPTSSHGPRPPSNHGPVHCPPSPDDELYYQKKKEEESYSRRPSMTPRGYPVPLTSSSSEDQFFSGVSQSTSNPSLPSVISANSSIIQDEVVPEEQEKELLGATKIEGPVVSVTEENDHDGYDGDHALESDEEDDSSDDDFIELSTKKRKPPVHRHSRSESVSNAELSRHQVRASISTVVRKSSRSGSNGTVKKVRSNSGSDMEIIHHESA